MTTHNQEEINSDRLFKLLQSISKFVDIKIRMYALGGTALTLLNIKKSTLDVDINIATKKEYDYTLKTFDNIGFKRIGTMRWISQEGLAFDIFHGSNIMGTDLLPDCLTKSKFIRSFGNIELYTLHLLDIIISKLARGDTRDFEDIKSILENEKIDIKELVDRYQKTMEISIVADERQKLLDLLEFKFKDWKFDINSTIIEEIKKWD